MTSRREFLAGASMAASAAAIGGCRTVAESFPAMTAMARAGDCNRVPYGDTIGDRLWMWGHHRNSFKALQTSKNEHYKLPFGTRIDMAAACREMNIPGCFVVRWLNLPTTAELPKYMPQFASMKRVGFSITDAAKDSFQDKVRLGFEYAEKMPNLTTLIMDDYWSFKEFTRPVSELRPLRERMHEKNLRLGIVMYADRDIGVDPSQKEVLDVCDEVTVWFWRGENLKYLTDRVMQIRELAGERKSILLGQYMWDFGGAQPISGSLMASQLAAATKLLDTCVIDGLIFHCTPLVDMGLDAVNVSKEWIAANGGRRWGTA